MNVTKKLAVAGFVVLLAACASKENNQITLEAPADVGDCQFDNGASGAAMWICDYPVEGYAVTAVGRQAKSAAGMSFMRKQAALDGRSAMAEAMRSVIKSKSDKFVGTTGISASETVDKVSNSMQEALTSETLESTPIVRSAVGPEGEVYLLLAMDKDATARTVQKAINNSMNNEQAAWQQFRKTDEFKNFKDDIENEFGGEIH
jgi:hypothetical protein